MQNTRCKPISFGRLLVKSAVVVLIQICLSGLAVAGVKVEAEIEAEIESEIESEVKSEYKQSCQSDQVELQVLGSGGPELDDGRASSAYIIWYKNKAKILIDTGPGSSVNFGLAKADFADLQGILLTHLHVDHSADLPAFIKGAYFSGRNQPLTVFGPAANSLMPATSTFIERLIGNEGAFAYLSDFLSGTSGANFKITRVDIPLLRDKIQNYPLNNDILLQSTFVHHGPVAAVAWRVNIAGCSISFSGDMSNQFQSLWKLAKNSDLLVVTNAIPEQAQGAARNLHMPPSEIGKIAKQANVKSVLLSHFMKRTLNSQTQSIDIIDNFFDGTVVLAEDLMRVSLSELNKAQQK